MNGHRSLVSAILMTAIPIIEIMMPHVSASAQGCRLCEIAGRIDREELIRTIRELSGTDSVVVDGSRVLIKTRSTLLPETDLARGYLFERIAGAGYEAEEQQFLLSVYYPDLLTAAVSVTGESLWAGSSEGEIYLMTSGGGWRDGTVISRIDAMIYDLELDHYGTLWAACKSTGLNYGELHFSADGGLSWQVKVAGNSANHLYALESMHFSSPTTAIASGFGGTLLRMRYYGGEWQTPYIYDPAIFYRNQLRGCASSGPGHIWVASRGGVLFESVDHGNNWTGIPLEGFDLRDVDFHGPDRGIVVGGPYINRTADGGETWESTTIDASLYTVAMIDTLTALAAGLGGAVWLTTDGGAAWEEIENDCPRDEDVWKMIDLPGGRVWVVGRNELLRLESPWSQAACEGYSLADSIMGTNYIFSREGLTYPRERVVLCAHYDSKNWQDPYDAPGADDNASGCAGVLEAARVLQAASFERSIDYLLFDGEEPGLIGSRAYAADLDSNQTIDAVLNLDMIGRDYGGGVRLELAGREGEPDSALKELVRETAAYLQLDLDCNDLEVRSPTSDHKSFWDIEGVPAIMLIEGEYYDNPHYHSATDVAQYIDYDFMTDVVKAAVGSLVRLAGLISADTLPSSVVLYQNFPNPALGRTRIRFELPSRMDVNLSLFDAAGREVAVLIRDTLGPGRHEYAWDGRSSSGIDVASGIYFLRLRAGGTDRTRKIVVLR